ncbi:MAG: RHS repeat-associated core domain-containing protein [Desulfobacteraceae bacterium]|jgi:RHS repeat-associated protein|nr:RHS repeat-associated core domain-containing protein [Desulfobacteraceae bacterium]
MESRHRYYGIVFIFLMTVLMLTAFPPGANCQSADQESDLTSQSDIVPSPQETVAKSTAESIGPSRDEFLSKILTPDAAGAFSETYQPFSGTMLINMVDIRLPGKGGLDLVIQRYYKSSIWNRTDDPNCGVIHHAAGVDTGDWLGGNGWQLHMGKVRNPAGVGSPIWKPGVVDNPVVIMPDGSEHVLYSTGDQNLRISAERWTYRWDPDTKTFYLTVNDGTVYEFQAKPFYFEPGCYFVSCPASSNGNDYNGYIDSLGTVYYQCTAVEDVHGNRIVIEYDDNGAIERIVDTWNRRIHFTYYDLEKGSEWYDQWWVRQRRIKTIAVKAVFEDKLQTIQRWEYKYAGVPYWEPWDALYPLIDKKLVRKIDLLTEVIPPEGRSWKFEYYPEPDPGEEVGDKMMLKKVTFPAGGTIEYNYSDTVYDVGQFDGTVQHATLASRTVSGRGVPTGTWTYAYPPEVENSPAVAGRDDHVTTITGPDGSFESYRYHGWTPYTGSQSKGMDDAGMWKVGLLKEKIASYGGQTVKTAYTWEEDSEISGDFHLSTLWNCLPVPGNPRRYHAGVHFIRPDAVTTETSRDGCSYRIVQSEFDEYGNPLEITEEGDLNRTTTLEYWYNPDRHILDGRPAYREASPGGRQQIWYDETGLPFRRMVNASAKGADDGIETEYFHHPWGDLWKEVGINTPQNHEVRYEDYSFGLPKKIVTEMADQPDIVINRDITPLGRLAWEEDGRGEMSRTEYTYDDLGRIRFITPPLGLKTEINFISTDSAHFIDVYRGDSWTQFLFDGLDRLVEKKDVRRNDKTQYVYNGFGSIVEEKGYLGGSLADTIAYDLLGRLALIMHPDQHSVIYGYDGSSVTVTDENNHVTTHHYAAFGQPDDRRLESVVDAEGTFWRYEYDPAKNILTAINAPGSSADRSFHYDHRHLMDWEKNPENGTVFYSYTPQGQVKTRTRGSETVVYKYDPAGRLFKIDPPGSTFDVTFEYNPAGLRTGVASSAGSFEYEYDGNQRLDWKQSTIDNRFYPQDFIYDDMDRLEQTIYPSGRIVEYQYNTKMQLEAVTDPDTSDEYIDNISYFPWGGTKDIAYQGGVQTSFGYDSRFRVNAIHTAKGAAKYLNLGFGYDGTGNLKTWTDHRDPSSSRSFTYDKLDRLRTANAAGLWGSKGYTYTPVGDRKTVTLNGAVSVYNYDLDTGRLTSVTGPGESAYIYDDFGRLKTSSFVSASDVIGEVGSVVINSNSTRVDFTRGYVDPVVFAQPSSFNGSDPCVVRIRDVGSEGFTVYIQEAPNKDGGHTTETISWVVLETGSWELEDGTRLEVGHTDTTASVGPGVSNSWRPITLATPLAAVPAVLTQVQTANDPHWVKTRQQNPGASGFQLSMEQDDAAVGAHGLETVGWLAIEPASGMWNGHPFQAGNTANAVTHNWYTISFAQDLGPTARFMASLATYDGGDGSALRYQALGPANVQVKVEEDTTKDSEINHTTEMVSFLAIGNSGLLTGTEFIQEIHPLQVSGPVPGALTIYEGDRAAFSVSASFGKPPYQYRWQFSSTSPVSGFSNMSSGNGVSGVTTSKITIDPVALVHDGYFRCRVSDMEGVLYSGAAELTVLPLPPPAVLIARDTFTNNGTNREIGDLLRDTATESGSLTWAAHPTVVFGSNHITHVGEGSHIGGIPFDPDADPSHPVATLQVDVDPSGAKWPAIGFSYSATGGYWGHGQVWMLLHTGGQKVVVWADGTNHQLIDVPAPGYRADAYNNLQIAYDSATNQVSAWVNGTLVLNGYDLDTIGFKPDINYAGFHLWNAGLGTTHTMRIDNFELSVVAGSTTVALTGTPDYQTGSAPAGASGDTTAAGTVPASQKFSTAIVSPASLSVKTTAQASETSSYDWSFLDTLKSATTGEGTYRYTYDGDNLRVRKVGGGNTVYYIRDGAGQVIAEYNGSGDLIAEYIYAAGRRIAKITASGQRHYYHTDAVGTPLAITSQSGVLSWRGENLPFGTEYLGSGDGDHFKFTGKEFEDHTGLFYFEARYYDPVVGRFISVDPMRGNPSSPVSLNRYVYGLNNPLRYMDPDGRVPLIAIPFFMYAYQAQIAMIAGASATAAYPTNPMVPDSLVRLNNDMIRAQQGFFYMLLGLAELQMQAVYGEDHPFTLFSKGFHKNKNLPKHSQKGAPKGRGKPPSLKPGSPNDPPPPWTGPKKTPGGMLLVKNAHEAFDIARVGFSSWALSQIGHDNGGSDISKSVPSHVPGLSGWIEVGQHSRSRLSTGDMTVSHHQ